MRHKARYIRAKRALYSSVIFLCCVFTIAYGHAQETEKSIHLQAFRQHYQTFFNHKIEPTF